MVATRYAPDWGGWRLVCEATIPQAVALSLGVNPDLLHSWKFRAQRAELAEFEKRISMARRWGLPGRIDIAADYEGREKTIYLREFVRYASSAGWDLPVSLREVAIGNEQATSPAARSNPGLRRK